MELKVRMVRDGVPVPSYAHPGDAGLDLYAAEDVELAPFERALVPTGVQVAIPRGCAGFVQPKSGLALKHGLSIVNTPGLIDSGYRGEIGVIVINLDPRERIAIRKGQKIAQLVIQKVEEVAVSVVEELDETPRGAGGFGSTGV